MAITAETATVYRSGRRRYMTLRAAVKAEVNAICKERYPTEQAEYDERGMMTYPGFHWSSLPRAEVIERRLKRLILNRFREQTA